MTQTEEVGLKEKIVSERKNGNIVLLGLDGLMIMPLKDFVNQPVDGLLYDLNRLEEVVLTHADDPKWINDYAVAAVIRFQGTQLAEKEKELITSQRLNAALPVAHLEGIAQLQEQLEAIRKQTELARNVAEAFSNSSPKDSDSFAEGMKAMARQIFLAFYPTTAEGESQNG